MRNLTLFTFLFVSAFSFSQNKLEDLLAAGIEDAQRFASGYISPAAEGVIYNLSNGWIQSANVKKPLRFEISVIGNISFVKDKNKSFTLNTEDYNNLQFRDGSTSNNVATAFGENKPNIIVFARVTDDTGAFQQEVEFELPQGLASTNVNFVPTAFLQARLGVFKATEVKVRYFPKIDYEDVQTELFGLGLQHEFTQWLPVDKIFPVAISGFIGFTNLNGSFDFTDSQIVEGANQRFAVKQNSWLFQVHASTKLPIINFYGGLGYVSGKSDFDVLGTYTVRAGTPLFETASTFENPFTVKNKVSGVKATLGTRLNLAFFSIYAEYNLAEYNTASAGIGFGI
ncbi:MAG: hypothetical protein COZ75_01130 [Flavobacteriaceae bacterium CG_4_8_14_3_um_filter_34_10]|nr:hypothetical protein [Flavobacteriia bacterium]OIP50282.1 MAG: hypothetical protein AUK33_08090 [Flavobacteriaceae bacterium CG2_30_34_30]PIQ19630.1 MAG: hypothetical protein COW66_00185 [Flavobacteriaceae bacterium CG18_big_fil_WC_8_21_14_2_50_34_36]PIV49041.1 MAG: hypothetical protein COS19_10565 [Flavobacteriaceae bacterium CG02_land_8_20_14_3_00_34_13]PIX10554.1 MAG: hypothetical protein COZ75_01130 [Flavobacteriaceae bacterium CG_4_8_14_3_um_filter_34_10]PIZ08509.1 MAG: hypothetical pr